MKKEDSNGITHISVPSENGERELIVFQPLWERSPRKFWAAHEGAIQVSLNEWQANDPELSLGKAVSRYVDGLPSDIPAEILLKIIEMVIEAWEKQSNAKAA